jgi:hypothetical protein
MRTIETMVYSINELPEPAKQTALQAMRDNAEPYLDHVIDFWQACLKDAGFNEIRINYSGFYSQGDGARFVGSYDASDVVGNLAGLDSIAGLLSAIKDAGKDAFTVYPTFSRYCHENTVEILFEDDVLLNAIRAVCKAIYKDLQVEYEYQLSDDYLTDDALNNNLEFTKDGSIY